MYMYTVQMKSLIKMILNDPKVEGLVTLMLTFVLIRYLDNSC